MDDRIEQLVVKIKALEEELGTALHEQQNKLFKAAENGRIEFENGVKDIHRQLKVGLFPWLRHSQLKHILSVPFIYGLIVPVVIFDLAITIYQAICFRLYGIERVQRSKYVVVDRHRLAYLNIVEKINCIYCEYVNGMIAYAREIGSRTEQFWCPIKHAHKMTDTHKRYTNFVDYGDADNYQQKAREARELLRGEESGED